MPLQAKALEALDQMPASDNPILFPNMRGGRIDFLRPLERASRAGAWTLGGRRALFLSPQQPTKKLVSRGFVKPSDGLEPSTPSLPCGLGPLPLVADGCESACLSRF